MHIPIRSAAPIVAAALSLISSVFAQDSCATAIVVGAGTSGPFTNVGMTNSTTLEGAPAPTCVASSFQNDFWCAFTAPCSGTASFNTCSMAAGDTVMAVYSGACGALTQLGCNDDSACGARSQVNGIAVTSGSTYYVRLDTFGTATLATFALSISVAGTGNADDCGCAGPLALGANAVDTLGSTVSTPAWSCGFVSGGDTWYTYTVGGAGCRNVQFDTLGAGLDTVLEVWSACGGTVLACNDDVNFPPGESQINLSAIAAGTSLRIRAAQYGGATGPFSINVSETSAAATNDECLSAIAVAAGANGPFNNTCATTSTPAFSCSGSAQADLWFDYTAAFTAPHTIDTLGSTFDTIMQVYDACGGVSLGCNDDISFPAFPESRLVLNLTAGITYKIRVAGFTTARGNITLNIRTGTLGGSITPDTTVSLCPSPATLNVAGDPWIGGTLSINLVGATGLGFTGYGFSPLVPIPSPCGCDIISDGGAGLGFFQFLSTYNLPIPVDPFLVGATVQFQGLDVFPSSGGCTFSGIPFGATNIWTAVIG
ncbi:MAG: hypothetical protein ABL982_21605 [Vicinamibacterales bacterium]